MSIYLSPSDKDVHSRAGRKSRDIRGPPPHQKNTHSRRRSPCQTYGSILLAYFVCWRSDFGPRYHQATSRPLTASHSSPAFGCLRLPFGWWIGPLFVRHKDSLVTRIFFSYRAILLNICTILVCGATTTVRSILAKRVCRAGKFTSQAWFLFVPITLGIFSSISNHPDPLDHIC